MVKPLSSRRSLNAAACFKVDGDAAQAAASCRASSTAAGASLP